MPQAAPRKCSYGRCPNVGHFNGPYCDEHRAPSGREHMQRRRVKVPDRPWKLLTDALKGYGNTICSVVDEYGVRCNQPAWGFHHILAAEDRFDVALHQENVVPVCKACHNTVESHPARARYVPSIWNFMGEGQQDIGVLPGATVTPAQEEQLWTLRNRRERFA